MALTEETKLRQRCEELRHALAVALLVSRRHDDETEEQARARKWALSVFGGGLDAAEQALDTAFERYIGPEGKSAIN